MVSMAEGLASRPPARLLMDRAEGGESPGTGGLELRPRLHEVHSASMGSGGMMDGVSLRAWATAAARVVAWGAATWAAAATSGRG